MNSLLLTTLARGLIGVLLIISLYLLYRGHNEPGGGFIGGLVAAVAFALAAKGLGIDTAKKMLRLDPRTIIGLGMLTALASGMVAMLKGEPIFTGQWMFVGLDAEGNGGFPLSNVLFFDIGVYLIVVGATMLFFFCLEEPES